MNIKKNLDAIPRDGQFDKLLGVRRVACCDAYKRRGRENHVCGPSKGRCHLFFLFFRSSDVSGCVTFFPVADNLSRPDILNTHAL